MKINLTNKCLPCNNCNNLHKIEHICFATKPYTIVFNLFVIMDGNCTNLVNKILHQ